MLDRSLLRATQPGRGTGSMFHGLAGSIAGAWLRRDVGLGVCLVLGGLLSLHAGLDNNWDLRNYHLYDPFARLREVLAAIEHQPPEVRALLRAALPEE